jgi:glycosyltransferase involved in cell wall biosynthesis
MTSQPHLPRISFGSVDPAAADRPDDSLRVLCVLPTLNPYGGVVSVVNAVNILIDLGHHVTLACLSFHTSDLVHPKTEPMHLEDWGGFPPELAAGHDVFLATSWETVPIVADLAGQVPDAVAFYYVQGFEPDFFGDDELEIREQAMATYSMIPNRFVKTRHLQRQLAEHGFDATVIPPGMNLDIFYPRAGPPSTRPRRVLAMARAEALDDHRGFSILVEVFRALARDDPTITLTMFGDDELPDLGFAVENLGRVGPSDLPPIYSSAQVFVDTSRFHGFGRTGAEALACGTAVVLSDSGGISEYAVDGDNAIVVPVGDVAATVAAIEDLLGNPSRMDAMAARGLETVSAFSDYAATAAIERLFRLAHRQPPDSSPTRG